MKKFDILIDTHEIKPFEFAADAEVDEIISRHIETGDYTIDGFEDMLCIERKASVSEIANNIGEKRFARQIERMEKIPYRYIVCEFTFEDVVQFPKGSTIPKYKWKHLRINSKFIVKKLSEYENVYGIEIIYAGNRAAAKEITLQLMKDFYAKHSHLQ